ncbi:MAG: tRNA (adenosine(37)-N6)-threonylcarbamoyltransferase complex ATPase subunit type 1 TsaE [Clostridia bacterium]|nr:tRNA (adenosine(37)-N6)-threonylcarbamoyltransferase complex ATPase subunit type 1 TsaE [Clostridia bacterium]
MSDFYKEYLSESEDDTEKIGAEFAKELKKGDFVAFFGNLGSGKTAFVRGVASVLCKGAHVSSPTYAIVNEYIGNIDIFHFDMYRITDDDSLYSVGFYDYQDRNGIIFTEWSENIEFALPENRYDVTFVKTGETGRKIMVQKKQ